MKAVLTQTGDFLREVAIEPISDPQGTYHLQFSSRLLSAKDPQAVQRNFSAILTLAELGVLRELLQRLPVVG
jgi:hypothetical protein